MHKQKRLLLMNIKELFLEFKNQYNVQVVFSKSCELRPAWCVTVDPKSAHSVCVFEIHQNLKLLINVIPGNIDYKELIGKIVFISIQVNVLCIVVMTVLGGNI